MTGHVVTFIVAYIGIYGGLHLLGIVLIGIVARKAIGGHRNDTVDSDSVGTIRADESPVYLQGEASHPACWLLGSNNCMEGCTVQERPSPCPALGIGVGTATVDATTKTGAWYTGRHTQK